MHLVPMIARHWPFPNGSGRILDKWAQGIDLGAGERLARTSDGFSIQVYADDLIGRHILMSGKFDRSVAQMLLDHARPGDTLLDIGANIGYVSALFLNQVKDGKAICFEPQPGIVDLLGKNMEQFGDRAVVRPVALGDEDGKLRFAVNEGNRGASRLSPDGEIEVEVVEAAKALRSIPEVSLLKIDVEGFEEPIFRNAAEELRRLRPRAILFEDQTGSASPDGAIGAILTALDYRIFGIRKQLLKTGLVPIRAAADCRFNDYLALA